MSIVHGDSARSRIPTSLCSSILLVASFAPRMHNVSAQCVDPVPSTPYEAVVAIQAWENSVAMRENGDFVVAYSSRVNQYIYEIRAQRFCKSGAALGTSAALSDANGPMILPSIASSRSGHFSVAWTGIGSVLSASKFVLLQNTFDFDDFGAIIPVEAPEQSADGNDEKPSTGASDAFVNRSTVAWSNGDAHPGLHLGIDSAQISTLRACDVGATCGDRVNHWLPCASTRSEDGAFAVAFGYDEKPLEDFSPYNIALMIFDADGILLDQLAGPDINDPSQWVNDPSSEDETSEVNTSQLSPAVSFVGEDIVVAWAGPALLACPTGPDFHIYVRRFKFDSQTGLRDPDPAAGEGRAGIFVVDNDPGFEIESPLLARPAVALTLATDSKAGRFVVAWNGDYPVDNRSEIHAQYFDNQGQPRGREFRVNQDTSPTWNGNERTLQLSGQHTIAYGAEDQFLATWFNWAPHPTLGVVRVASFTLLPPDYARTTIPACGVCLTNPELCDPCLKGDANNDCLVNFEDIAPFVDALLFGDFTCSDILELCRVDMNNDARINGLDIQCFVNTLVGNECTLPTLRIIDCNLNGIPDDEDIAAQTSSDVNSNGVPDECETDCNGNDVPDDWDIVKATSYDCDTDGIPDECGEDCNENDIADVCDLNPSDPDGNSLVSADCNTNGYPDECEPDCNTNGVPDDCDMDPTDPDGDQWVSPDCNNNEYPDECDLSLPPPFGSSDCNTNGVPDECDIAACENDPACDDCNSNGIPDGCDIAAEISEDVNTNGIPDECEGEGLMGGGGESMAASSETGESEWSEEAAWEAFYEWSIAQCWGPGCEAGMDEQFAAMIDKLRELGLPTQKP